MLDKELVRRSLDARLAALQPDEARRRRIISAALQASGTHKVKGEKMMRSKLSTGVLLVLVLLLSCGSVAVAMGLNLFEHFGMSDPRYAQVAENALLTTSQPVRLEDGTLGQVNAYFDSAYFDGLSLHVAMAVEHQQYTEAWQPTPEELASMLPEENDGSLPMPVIEQQDILQGWQDALQNGTPYGFRQISIWFSDHVTTDDGIDIPPYTLQEDRTEDGIYLEMREFASPLPQSLRSREELTLNCRLTLSETRFWFDGQRVYRQTLRQDAGSISGTVRRTEGMVRRMQGTWQTQNGTFTATVDVSTMAAALCVEGSGDLRLALGLEAPLPEDAWIEWWLEDEQGIIYRGTEAADPSALLPQETSFLGVGTLPETLTLHAARYTEGVEQPTEILSVPFSPVP